LKTIRQVAISRSFLKMSILLMDMLPTALPPHPFAGMIVGMIHKTNARRTRPDRDFHSLAGESAYDRFDPPGRRIDVGGHRLYTLMAGVRQPGQPLVVLEAGHADWSKCWAAVQPAISRFARTVSYDRAGSGWSDPGPAPRTPQRMVDELHTLLERAGEAGPYLLVGHSMGAPLARLFYQRYPTQVCGMVWVDTAHERMDRFFPFWKSALIGLLLLFRVGQVSSRVGLVQLASKRQVLKAYPWIRGEQEQAELIAQLDGKKYFDWLYAETVSFARSENWPYPNPSLGSLPVISIEAEYSMDAPRFYPDKQWREFLVGWRAIHEDACRLSTRTLRIPVQTGHAIMHEAPYAVIDAVRQMLERKQS
jgi:pimeloyl-ACP methyl ester carboxylesterase